jgi:quercetin dioxygenase-like cupin family protein
MSGNATADWATGWTAAEPLQLEYAWAPRDGGEWADSAHGGLEARDLGLAAASGGKMGVNHLRAKAGAARDEDPIAHAVDFEYLYVLAGSITIEPDGGEPVTLGPDDTVQLPRGARHRRTGVSDDFEAVEIVAPAVYETTRDADVEAAGEPLFTFEGPDAYTLGDGPRKFFNYRDLGTRGPTADRIHLHCVKATGTPGEGTGWHYHSMAQWFMILGGQGHIRVEDGPDIELNRIDAMCIGSGPQMRHNVAPFSGDYAVLEMCVPAAYETIAVDRPEGAADGVPGARD